MDDLSAPLVAKFCTSRFKYCYDANTGVIARVDDRLYGALREISPFEEFPAHPAGGVADVFLDAGDHRLDAINKMGLFRAAQIRATLAHPETVKGCLGGILGRFSRMTLEVTQRCNLRCRYCPHTRGSGAGRAHGNTDMSWETARTAVDYFADHLLTSADPASGLPALSFYGGEPLLVPRLIRQCVDYVLAKIPSVRFSCTTNGTPLTNPTADFIAANDFNLLVSLDGPAEIHDRERRSLGGRGSFDRLWANLNRLLERHPDYYRRSVHFQSTVADPRDCGRIVDFFLAHQDLFGPGKVQMVPSSGGKLGTVAWASATGNLFARYEKRLLSNSIGEDAESRLLQGLFERPFIAIHNRRISVDGKSTCGLSEQPCFPGYGRILVATDGELHICEKVNRRIACGALDRGVQGDQVMALYDLYFRRRRDCCYRCWAIGLCGLCYVHFIPRSDERDPTVEQRQCRAAIEYNRRVLIRYCSILEESPTAFDHLEGSLMIPPPVPDWAPLVKVQGGGL